MQSGAINLVLVFGRRKITSGGSARCRIKLWPLNPSPEEQVIPGGRGNVNIMPCRGYKLIPKEV